MIDTLIRVSLAASEEIIAVYSDPVFARWLKDDSSPVTEADMRAEACLVAAGHADIYPRLGRTMEWDTAAGDAILRAAGGIVVDLDGYPLVYNKRHQRSGADFANGHFVAYGDANLLTSEKSGAEVRCSPRLPIHEYAADESTPRPVDAGS